MKWDGPDDPDEEIVSMIEMKAPHEIEEGIIYSQNGIVKYIENILGKENSEADSKWVKHLDTPVLKYYLKKGGTKLSAN